MLKKLINKPARYVDEARASMLAAHSETFASQGRSSSSSGRVPSQPVASDW